MLCYDRHGKFSALEAEAEWPRWGVSGCAFHFSQSPAGRRCQMACLASTPYEMKPTFAPDAPVRGCAQRGYCRNAGVLRNRRGVGQELLALWRSQMRGWEDGKQIKHFTSREQRAPSWVPVLPQKELRKGRVMRIYTQKKSHRHGASAQRFHDCSLVLATSAAPHVSFTPLPHPCDPHLVRSCVGHASK